MRYLKTPIMKALAVVVVMHNTLKDILKSGSDGGTSSTFEKTNTCKAVALVSMIEVIPRHYNNNPICGVLATDTYLVLCHCTYMSSHVKVGI